LLGGPQAQLIGRVLWEEFFQNRDWPTAAAIACGLLVLLLVLPAAVLGGIGWLMGGREPLPPPLVRFTAQAHKGRGRIIQAVTSLPPGAAAPSVATGHRQAIQQARDETGSRLHP
jgi:hypothetical protein